MDELAPCPECDGTGRHLDGGPCLTCDGTGEVWIGDDRKEPTLRYAVFHDDTLELLGTLAAREYPEQAFGPIRDGRTFYLPMTQPVPARFADYADSAVAFTRVEFRPLILKNAHNHTFALFVECHPDDLSRVRGFKPI